MPEHVQRLRWPADRLRQERRDRLRDLLRAAKASSPWHRDRLAGIDPDRFEEADLAGLAPNARNVVAERSGHYVHQAEPELVVAAIRQVVEAVRDPASWATPGAGTPTA